MSTQIGVFPLLSGLLGVAVHTEDGEYVGKCLAAAPKGIAKVVLSRNAMATPGVVHVILID